MMPFLEIKVLMSSLCFENPPSASLRVLCVADPRSSQKSCSCLLLPLLGQSNVVPILGSSPQKDGLCDITGGILSPLVHLKSMTFLLETLPGMRGFAKISREGRQGFSMTQVIHMSTEVTRH